MTLRIYVQDVSYLLVCYIYTMIYDNSLFFYKTNALFNLLLNIKYKGSRFSS